MGIMMLLWLGIILLIITVILLITTLIYLFREKEFYRIAVIGCIIGIIGMPFQLFIFAFRYGSLSIAIFLLLLIFYSIVLVTLVRGKNRKMVAETKQTLKMFIILIVIVTLIPFFVIVIESIMPEEEPSFVTGYVWQRSLTNEYSYYNETNISYNLERLAFKKNGSLWGTYYDVANQNEHEFSGTYEVDGETLTIIFSTGEIFTYSYRFHDIGYWKLYLIPVGSSIEIEYWDGIPQTL